MVFHLSLSIYQNFNCTYLLHKPFPFPKSLLTFPSTTSISISVKALPYTFPDIINKHPSIIITLIFTIYLSSWTIRFLWEHPSQQKSLHLSLSIDSLLGSLIPPPLSATLSYMYSFTLSFQLTTDLPLLLDHQFHSHILSSQTLYSSLSSYD